MADEQQAEEEVRPAWSSQFSPDVLKAISSLGPLGEITREWAWGGSTGKGVKVAVVDSGIEYDHPAVGDAVKGGVIVEYDGRLKNKSRVLPDDQPRDLCGHGTACAGIIHLLAPEAKLYSVRVIGKDFSGRAMQFAGGLRWAIENGMHVVNLSLSTSMQEYYAIFHELTDDAYFHNIALVSAVNNIPVPSYPSLYSSVFSVAAHEEKDPFTFYYNPNPPVEFGAPGIDIDVAWLDKEYTVGTGNSFAAPHIAGIVTLIRSKHPELTPFQIKTVLYACANNVEHHAAHSHSKT
jgi:subtilisin